MNTEKNALTLVEVLIAVLVFSIGIIGVILLFPISIENISVSQDLLIATELASSTIEFFNQPIVQIEDAIKNNTIMTGFMPIKDFDSGGDLIIINSVEYDNLGDDAVIERYMEYERAISLSTLSADADLSERYSIVVTIRWNDSRGRSRTFSLSGVLYPYKT